MKEAQFIGSLMPSHPDFQPIIEQIREKYQLPEVDPKGEPIKEIYLGDEITPLEAFQQKRHIDSRAQNPSPFCLRGWRKLKLIFFVV